MKTKKTTRVKKAKKPMASKIKNVNSNMTKIRRGDFTRIAKATGYDNSHVARVLRGQAKNPSGEIVRYASKMVSKRK